MVTRTTRANHLLVGALLILGIVAAMLVTPSRSDALLFNNLRIVRVGTVPPDTPGAREFNAIAGQFVDVVVEHDDLLFHPVPVLSAKTVRLTTTGPDGATFAFDGVINAGESSVTIKAKWTTPYDGVVLTAKVDGNSATPDTADGYILGSGATVPAATQQWAFNGTGPLYLAPTDACPATTQHQTCARLGAHDSTTDQFLGLAPCDQTIACRAGTEYVTWLAGVDPTKTNQEHPDQLTVTLDKSVAGGVGVAQFQLSFQLEPDGVVLPIPLCPGGVMGAGQSICELFRNATGPSADRVFGFLEKEDGKIVIR